MGAVPIVPSESTDYEFIRVELERPVTVSSGLTLPPLLASATHLDPDQLRAAGARLVERGEIARGGMGAIHAVFDRSILRQVALKRLDPEFAKESPAAVQLLVEEAQITGQLEHPNIVPIYDLGAGPDGTPMFTMKLLHGQTMTELINAVDPGRRSAADLRRLLEVFLKVCDAISFAHSRGVIHRDLKPDNVMIGSHGQVYVMDWGCALLLHMVKRTADAGVTLPDRETVRVKPDAVLGTAAYMAPEQALGQLDKIDERSDVFGLGGILYEVLTYQPPYVAMSSVQAVLLARKGQIPHPTAVCPEVPMPGGLVDIAMTALAIEPDARYPSVAALRDAVEGFLAGPWWCSTRTFAPGTVVLREGEQGDCAYIIERGSCEAYRSEGATRRLLRTMGPGDVFGETAIITDQPRSATVEAVDEVVCHVVTRGAMEDELGMDSWIGAFVRALAGRFREAEDRLERRGSAGDGARVLEAIRVHLAAVGGEAAWSPLAEALADQLALGEEQVTAIAFRSPDLAIDRVRDRIRRR